MNAKKSRNRAGDAAVGTEVPVAEAPRAEAPAPERKHDSSIPELGDATEVTGALLRQIREAKGIPLKTIAEATKINAHSLRAIEEERFDDIPNVRVYVRGFVRCIAAEIGLDPDLVSKSYLKRWEAWDHEQKFLKKQ